MQSSFEIVKYLLNKNNYYVDDSKVRLHLLSSPDSQNLKSVSDTLDYFDIKNIVAKIPLETIDKLPETFLCVLSISGNKIVAIATQLKNSIELFFADKKKRKVSISEFSKLWDGTILAVEKQETRKNNLHGTAMLLCSIIIILIINAYLPSQDIFRFLFLLVTLLGLFISYIIVQKEVDVNTYLGDKVCNIFGTQEGCNAVINSSYSKLYNLVNLGDICIIYFASFTLITGLISFKVFPIALISFLSD